MSAQWPAQFHLPGAFVTAEPYGSGHINDTYRVTMQANGAPTHYIVQWINHHVFQKSGCP